MNTYRAEHCNWNSVDYLVFQNNTFYRKLLPREKGTFKIHNNVLELHWNLWPKEILYTTDNHETYFCKTREFKLIKIHDCLEEHKEKEIVKKVEEKEEISKSIQENPEKEDNNIILEKKPMEISKEFVKNKINEIQNHQQTISKPKEINQNQGIVKEMIKTMENKVTNGYYINLENRTDRNDHVIENVLKNTPFLQGVKRMEAIKDGRRGVGCTLSHIKCLEECLKNKDMLNHYIILEDDIRIDHAKFNEFVTEFNKIKDRSDWDVIVLGGSYLKVKKCSGDYNRFYKIWKSQTTVGYIIKRKYITKLINNFKEGMERFLQTGYYLTFAMDVHWHLLQQKDNWYIFSNFFCDQIESYSDIEKSNVNYQKCYTNIKFIK